MGKLKGPQVVRKLWGHEEILVNNEQYCGKFLFLQRGWTSSVHYHNKKDETFVCLEGKVRLALYEIVTDPTDSKAVETVRLVDIVFLKEGQGYRLKPGVVHGFSAVTRRAKILEVSTPHDDLDVYRLTESHKL